jgi:hypothetical protein
MASVDSIKRDIKRIATDLITAGDRLNEALREDDLRELVASVGDTVADIGGLDNDLEDIETLLDRVVKARSKR